MAINLKIILINDIMIIGKICLQVNTAQYQSPGTAGTPISVMLDNQEVAWN
jgi:hypothetical protein